LTALQNQSVKRGRKKKLVTEEEDTNGYLDVIINLGKSFGVMMEPWITPAIFTAKPDELIEDIVTIFKDPLLYSKSLTLALYIHVPERLHKMVDAAEFPAFASNVRAALCLEFDTAEPYLISFVSSPIQDAPPR
jgi:hypothetical protein